MHRLQSAIILAGLLPSALGLALPPNFDICPVVDITLEFLTGWRPTQKCQDRAKAEVVDWCRGYLAVQPVTEYASTLTPVVEDVVRETTMSTSTETVTELTTTTTETTTTTTTTDIAYETTTTTTTLPWETTLGGANPLPVATPLGRRSLLDLFPCPPVNKPALDILGRGLLKHKVAQACKCLDPKPVTVTVPVTTADATTTTRTTTLVEGVTQTETESVTVEATSTSVVEEVATKTETATATATYTPPPRGCDAPYLGVSISNQNWPEVGSLPNEIGVGTGFATGRECCQACEAREGCVLAWWQANLFCQMWFTDVLQPGQEVTAQCPNGLARPLSPILTRPGEGGTGYVGPCAHPDLTAW